MTTTRDQRLELLQGLDAAQKELLEAQSEWLNAKMALEASDVYKAYQAAQEKISTASAKHTDAEQAVLDWMLAADVKSVDFGNKKVTVKDNPPALVVENEDMIPNKYIKVKMTSSVDKNAIKEAIKNGEVIQWVKLEVGHTLLITERTNDDLPF